MTNEEKFVMGKVLYKNDNGDYVLELWGGSTKHPDAIFHMEDFEFPDWCNKSDPVWVDYQVLPWLLECASKLSMTHHAYELAKWALNWYEKFYFKDKETDEN